MVKVKKNDIYMFVFLLMSLVYGGFSSSTPDSIGIAEIFVALCLLEVLLSLLHSFGFP